MFASGSPAAPRQSPLDSAIACLTRLAAGGAFAPVRVGRYRPPAGRVCHSAASVAGGVAAPNAG